MARVMPAPTAKPGVVLLAALGGRTLLLDGPADRLRVELEEVTASNEARPIGALNRVTPTLNDLAGIREPHGRGRHLPLRRAGRRFCAGGPRGRGDVHAIDVVDVLHGHPGLG